MMLRQNEQHGYTLIESIMFIGVIIMVGISAINLINSMLDKYRMSRVTQQIVDLQKSIDFRFSSAEDYNDISPDMLIDERVVPGDMVDNGELYHAYKGEVTISSDNQGSVYDISFNDLPYTPCIELGMIDWTSGYSSHLVYIKINNTYFAWQGSKVKELPAKYGDVMTACKKDNANVITWQFQ